MIVRAATREDYAGFARFWDELELHQPVPPIESWVTHLCPNTIFLDDDGHLAAYNLSFAFGARGDVRQVVVDPAYRRRGVGKLLMAAVAAKLRAAGCTDWRLEVKTDNTAAIALYQAIGMRPLRAIDNVHMDRDARTRFAATRSGRHAVIAVTPDDDRALEAAHDLGAGQIARWRRARGTSPLLRVGAIGLVQVWADASPERGLLFPFLVSDPDVAAHLIACSLSGPAVFEICVVHPDVHAALLAGGARQVEQQLEMAGEIPR